MVILNKIPILDSVAVAEKFNIVIGPQVSFLMQKVNNLQNNFWNAERKIVEDDANRLKLN